ncbi:MAG: DUF4349 domain-containing protein [Oscillospiraceae bacterium]
MKKTTALLLSLLLLFALCACGAGSKSSDAAMNSSIADAYAPAEVPKAESGGGMYDVQDSFTSVESAIYSDPDAKVIRTAELTIQTLDFNQSVTDLAALTEANGGYYETAQVDSGGYYDQYARRSAYYVVRIPKENFVAFRDAVGTVGHIYSITEDAQNVGEEYYDTEARLETLTTKRERLLALLEKADVMEDIISLENALADVQYEIDMHTSALRKYDSLIDYSTFTIYLNEVVKIEQEPGPQESFGTKLLSNLKGGLSSFGEAVQSFALWLARNLITLVILAVIIVIVVKVILHYRKKRRNKSSED